MIQDYIDKHLNCSFNYAIKRGTKVEKFENHQFVGESALVEYDCTNTLREFSYFLILAFKEHPDFKCVIYIDQHNDNVVYTHMPSIIIGDIEYTNLSSWRPAIEHFFDDPVKAKQYMSAVFKVNDFVERNWDAKECKLIERADEDAVLLAKAEAAGLTLEDLKRLIKIS